MHPRRKPSTTFPLRSRYFPTAEPQWVVPREKASLAQIWGFWLPEQLVALFSRHELHCVGPEADKLENKRISYRQLSEVHPLQYIDREFSSVQKYRKSTT